MWTTNKNLNTNGRYATYRHVSQHKSILTDIHTHAQTCASTQKHTYRHTHPQTCASTQSILTDISKLAAPAVTLSTASVVAAALAEPSTSPSLRKSYNNNVQSQQTSWTHCFLLAGAQATYLSPLQPYIFLSSSTKCSLGNGLELISPVRLWRQRYNMTKLLLL